MKKRIIKNTIILAGLVLCLGTTGCNKNKGDKVSIADAVQDKEEKEKAEEDKNTISWSEDAKSSNDDEKSGRKINGGLLSNIGVGKPDNEQIKDAYMKFLSDEELAVADISEEGYFREGNRYSFSEIINEYIKNESAYVDDYEIGLRDAQYAYIDCGNDGSTEMVVQLTYQMYDETNRVYFFGYRDGGVHILGSDEWGYRSIMDVNEAGYVINGGSGGATLWVNDHYYYNAEGKRIFLYNFQQQMGFKTARVPKYYMRRGFERPDYPDDDYEVGGDMVYIYNFNEYVYDENETPDDTYDKYYSRNMYCFLDEKERDIEPDSRFVELYKEEGIKWYKKAEIERLVKEHEEELGATGDIRDADPVSWESIVELGIMEYPVISDESGDHDDDYKVGQGEGYTGYGNLGPTYYISNDNPKPYQSSGIRRDLEYKPVTLKQVSCVENDVIDTDKWFDKTGTREHGTTYSDDIWGYELTGDMGYGTMSVVNVYDKDFNDLLYTFDLSDFYKEPGYENTDFVERGIHYAVIKDGYLYLNIYHRTYAEDCPENAYILCIDINDGSVVWISDPLVSNSDNFIIWGDSIITGYGFTAENDFIYILNRYNGRTTDGIKVKKSPDYFAVVNNELWVRTYSYDYVFSIN